MRARAILSGALAALLAAGCGRAPAGGKGPGDFGDPRLALADEAREPAPRDALVRRLRPGGRAPWSVDAEHALVPGGLLPDDPPGVRLLSMKAVPPHEVRLATRVDGGSFDRISVLLRARTDLSLRFRFERGEHVLRSPPRALHVRRSADPEIAVMDLDRAPRGRVDTLVLDVDPAPGSQGPLSWQLEHVDLVRRAPGAGLPPVGAPALVAVGGEARRAVALLGGRPLAARAQVPPGGVLRGAVARPPGRVDTGGTVAVAVRTRAGPASELRVRLPDSERWEPFELALEGTGSPEARVTLALEGADACLLAIPTLAAPRPDPPLVLLVTSDTHRYDHTAPARSGLEIHTPTLDELAREGVWFERCFAPANITLPSHVAIMTGVGPRDSGVRSNEARIAPAADTLAERFAAAGWSTFAAVSARHLGDDWSGIGQGFDRMVWPQRFHARGEVAAGFLTSWIEANPGRPVFAWLHLFDPHAPYTPPPPWSELYYPKGVNPFRAPFPEPGFPSPKQMVGLRDPEYARAMYRAEVTYADDVLGRLLRRPRLQDAVVALVGDHGESLGQHGIWWSHARLYPDTLHVPLVLRWPGGPRGVRVAGQVEPTDLGRTLLDLAGLPGARFGGRDLRAALEDGDRGQAHFALEAFGQSASITRWPWHLILILQDLPPDESVREEPEPRHSVLLFDLSEDPGAERDRCAAEHERARLLRAELIAWLESAHPSGWGEARTLDQAQRSELARLGYTGGPDGPAQELFDPSCSCEQCARWH